MSRHPYTNACDFIRQFANSEIECTLSRSQASQIRQAIAEVIGMDDAELAEKLSVKYQEETNQ